MQPHISARSSTACVSCLAELVDLDEVKATALLVERCDEVPAAAVVAALQVRLVSDDSGLFWGFGFRVCCKSDGCKFGWAACCLS